MAIKIFLTGLIFMIIIFIYNLLTKKYINRDRLVIIFGKKGCGKTTYLCKLAYKNVKAGNVVYSNVPLKISGIRYCNPLDLKNTTLPTNSVLLWDESNLDVDNRTWKSTDKGLIEYIRLMRHYKIRIFMFSQTFDVDKKLRDLADDLYIAKKYLRTLVILRKVDKYLDVRQAGSEGSNSDYSAIVENYRFTPLLLGAIKTAFIPKWSKLFNSFDTPYRDEISYKIGCTPEFFCQRKLAIGGVGEEKPDMTTHDIKHKYLTRVPRLRQARVRRENVIALFIDYLAIIKSKLWQFLRK